MMKLLRRSSGALDREQTRRSRRVTWQAASLLLAYPDAGHRDRLDAVDDLLGHLPESDAAPLAEAVRALRALPEFAATVGYVDTFDLHNRTTLLLTYWTEGDTRNRGEAMLAFARAYRKAGAQPPASESADHLAVVLEFAATVDPEIGLELLAHNRPAIDLLHQRLTRLESPYGPVLGAVAATLPAATDADVARAEQLAMAGPPAEAVGLQPFTLTVPPRRTDDPLSREGAHGHGRR